MTLYNVFKKNARLALKYNWSKAIAILLLVISVGFLLGIMQGVISSVLVATPVNLDSVSSFQELFSAVPLIQILVPLAFMVLNTLLLVPLSLGQIRWYNKLVHGKSKPVSDVFHYYEGFRKYCHSLWYSINLTIRQSFWAILFYAVPIGTMTLSILPLIGGSSTRMQATLSTFGIMVSGILIILATVLYIAYMMKYFLTPYLIADDPAMSVNKAIKTSIRFTRGYRFSLFGFGMSFIGWILLCFFVVPVLFVDPYMQTSLAMYARYIIEKNRASTPVDSTKEFVVGETETAPSPPDPDPLPDTEDGSSGSSTLS